MKHALQALILHSNPEVPITAAEFLQLRVAAKTLLAAFALEEMYDLLLANHHELEVSVLQTAVTEMTRWNNSYEDHYRIRMEFNRRSLNLLSSARLYLDQFEQWMKEAGANPKSAIARTNHFYDHHFEYRFMEALRNHVQHVGRAVHGVNTKNHWFPPGRTDQLRVSVTPYTSRKDLEQDQGFKKKVLLECPDKIPIIPAARVYVEDISAIHDEVRIQVESLAGAARSTVIGAIAAHESAAGQRFPGLAAVAIDKKHVKEQVPLHLDWDDVRLKLVKKNRRLSALARSYVTSQHDA